VQIGSRASCRHACRSNACPDWDCSELLIARDAAPFFGSASSLRHSPPSREGLFDLVFARTSSVASDVSVIERFPFGPPPTKVAMPPSRQRRWILRPKTPSIDQCYVPLKPLSRPQGPLPATSARLCRRTSASAFSSAAKACLSTNLAADVLTFTAPLRSLFRARRPHLPLGTNVLSGRWGSALVDFCHSSDPRARSAESIEPRSANLTIGSPLECGPDRR
jgi:hypothetical protein